jgi:hypothetical protein
MRGEQQLTYSAAWATKRKPCDPPPNLLAAPASPRAWEACPASLTPVPLRLVV